MFDTNKIAKKIKNARNEKNMTQVDLADAMGVSYQAVSNWERGNSMPDISKISDLCKILGLTLEDLMGEEESAKTVKKILNEEESNVSLEELAKVAPIVPPKKVEKVFEENKKKEDSIDIDALIILAPYLDDEYLAEIAERVSVNNLSKLIGLAPFLEDETLEKLVLKYDNPINDIGSSDLIGLAPFLEEDTLDILVTRYLESDNCTISDLVGLCPYLDETTVRKIAEYAMKAGSYDTLTGIAPFM